MRYIGQRIFKFFLVSSPLAATWLLGAMEQNLTGSWAEWCFAGIVLFWVWVIYQIKKLERERRRRERRERLAKSRLAA